jgi:D-hydroxyproline dehydrogenase subunit beta
MENKYDVAVIGAGIVGLAVAYHAAQKGKKVAVFDRSPKSMGASIRNFGLIWPLGQPAGPRFERAMRSRATWLELSKYAGIDVQQNGSLTLAYHDDEQAVLEEFYHANKDAGYDCELLNKAAVAGVSTAVNLNGLKMALYSRTECTVSPRAALPQLANYLEQRLGVIFYWNCAITQVTTGQLANFYDSWQAEQIFVCSGQDFETLYRNNFKESGITRCKLQMMRTNTQPNAWKLGPSLCAGLTLRHYDNFADCPSLHSVSARYDQENIFFKKWGIHVLLSQNEAGELIIGDSHEYGLDVPPFDRQDINDAILTYLSTFACFSDAEIVETWHGIYPKIQGRADFVLEPEPQVHIVNGLSGAGMTMSFGLAQEISV